MENEKFETWAIVEVMGHNSYSGLVTEQVIAGAAFVRVDVPEVETTDWQGRVEVRPAFTKYLGAASIYAITPCTQEAATEAARRTSSRPTQLLDYQTQRKALPSMYEDDAPED